MTKIDIFSGFLGAGKTTLIKKLIKEAYSGEKLVLIENEFGEIGIDGGFLKDSGIEITEMNSGCICCSLVGDFTTSLKEVLSKFTPDRILIEPSGVGKLSDVIKAVLPVLSDDVLLNSSTAVVDASKCKMYLKNFGEFFGNQIENADCIVLSRTDIADQNKISNAINLIKEINQNATIITTPIEQLKGEDILKAMEKTDSLEMLKAEIQGEEKICPECGHHHHNHEHHNHEHHDHSDDCPCGCHGHHHAEEVFTSWGKETNNTYTSAQISKILEMFDNGEYGAILRAKGYLKGNSDWIYFDYVPGQAEIRSGSPAVTGRICVIGSDIDETALCDIFGLEA